MTQSDRKSVKFVLEASAEYLSRKAIGQPPRHVSELLMARLLKCPRLELYLRYDESLAERHLEAMRRGVRRLAAGEPVQYVLGQTSFMGNTFKVDKRALIPRPETEILVERVLADAWLWQQANPAIVDLGTGSGCIVISLAKARPDARYLALDMSKDAIALAKENAQLQGVSDGILFAAAQLPDVVEPETVHAVVANLPYVPTREYEELPVHIREHEPRRALDGGPDGLDVIRDTIQDAAIVLVPDGLLFLETAADQGALVTGLMKEAGFSEVSVGQDLAGLDRIVTGVLRP